jgi:chromosome segregation ATPase
MAPSKAIRMPTKTQTEVAVLQVQVDDIKSDISEIKADIKGLNATLGKNNDSTHSLLKEMQEASTSAHKSMSDKIGTLEKWRWMMMGAGIALGALGFKTLGAFLGM